MCLINALTGQVPIPNSTCPVTRLTRQVELLPVCSSITKDRERTTSLRCEDRTHWVVYIDWQFLNRSNYFRGQYDQS
jgi:hypothetical protein